MLRDASQRNHARDTVWHMPHAAMLLVLARIAIVRAFREE
jgi:hypothetical protein